MASHLQNTGSRAQDVTGDQWPDLVARKAGTGELLVYPHVGRWEGAGSWPTPVVAGHGWQIMDWIGVGEVTGDDWADVIARRSDNGVLLVYPHTGVFHGDQTWGAPVVVGHGWGGLRTILVQDVTLDGFDDLVVSWGRDGDESIYVYAHSRTFQGVGTWGERERVGEYARESWLMATEWSGDDAPDLLHHDFELGTLFLSPHNRSYAGENTWSSAPPIQVSGDHWFTYDKVDYLLLADADGDGYQDILSRRVNGELWAYLNTRRMDGAATLSPPVTIGWGWGTFDMIT